jgi:hypothetical protein
MKAMMKGKKVKKVMNEFKLGTLNIGKSSKKVRDPEQAIAIGLAMENKKKRK